VRLLRGRERGLDLREPADRVRPRGAFRGMLELLELALRLGRDRDARARERARDLDRALPARFDRGRDGLAEILRERLRLELDPVPIRATGELAELREALGRLGRNDAERFELTDLLFDLFLERFRGLALLLQRLRLFLEDTGQSGGADPRDVTRARRGAPP